MADKKIYFISDLHLGATYDNQSRAKERGVVDWLQSIEDDVSELYMLGDVLDYWFEYRTVVPRGYIRFFGQLARMVDRGVKITWMIGNHDIWLFDYLRDEIGITVVDGSLEKELNGLKFYMAHGDGVGRLPLGFRFIRSVFRNRVCQKLYSAIHPRWTIPFAHRWSTHSRLAADCTPPF
ncbi:MAG: UDP-2,3-diacylglucosamine diphosphatase, partial [Muribaculaceae bacterium]|nr:UDP-2,3-diacylglucosamine diphosphatase [Muribaculaceae bacterium]